MQYLHHAFFFSSSIFFFHLYIEHDVFLILSINDWKLNWVIECARISLTTRRDKVEYLDVGNQYDDGDDGNDGIDRIV